MVFFPIEDEAELTRLRALLSPFMQNVRKCGEVKGNSTQSEEARERIIDDIINTASSDVDQELIDGLSRVMIRPENRTLHKEHNLLRAINRR